MRNLFVEKSYGQLVKFTTQIFISTLMVLIAENYALLYNPRVPTKLSKNVCIVATHFCEIIRKLVLLIL